jgi:hypothetical protein
MSLGYSARATAASCAAAVVLVSGVRAAAAPLPDPLPAPRDGEALIYIYRLPSFAFGLRNASFYIDNVKVVGLGYNECTVFIAPAGAHVIKQQWPLDLTFGHGDAFEASWESGATYYYRFSANGAVSPTNKLEIRWSMSQVDAEVGRHAMSICRYQQPSNLTKLVASQPAGSAKAAPPHPPEASK